MKDIFAPGTDAPHIALQQHPAHLAALRAAGVQATRLPLADDGWANVIMRRAGLFRLALVPRGPVWPDERDATGDNLRALRRALPRGTALLVNCDRASPHGARALPLVTPQTVAEWDLRPDTAMLRAGLHQKWRNRLTRADARLPPMRNTLFPVDPGHWLLRIEARQARSRGYRPWPSAVIAAHARLGSAHLFTIGADDKPIAAMLFLLHGARATYQIGWSGDQGRRVSAHTALLWHAALALRRMGAETLDLGTIDTETAPGLARFKLGTGARARRLGPTLLVP